MSESLPRLPCNLFESHFLMLGSSSEQNSSMGFEAEAFINIECTSNTTSPEVTQQNSSSDLVRKSLDGKESFDESQMMLTSGYKFTMYYSEATASLQDPDEITLKEDRDKEKTVGILSTQQLRLIIKAFGPQLEQQNEENPKFPQFEMSLTPLQNNGYEIKLGNDVIFEKSSLKDEKASISALKDLNDQYDLPPYSHLSQTESPHFNQTSLGKSISPLVSAEIIAQDSLFTVKTLKILDEDLRSKPVLDGLFSNATSISELSDISLSSTPFMQRSDNSLIKGNSLLNFIQEKLKKSQNKAFISEGLEGKFETYDSETTKRQLNEQPICGDGFRQSPEACDDGNQIDGDGCSSDCLSIESNWSCISTEEGKPDVCLIRYKKSKASPSEKWISDLTLIGVISSVIINMAACIINHQDPRKIFSSVNQIQLMLILLLFPFDLPPRVVAYLKSLKGFLFLFDFKCSFPNFHELFKSFDYEQSNSQLKMLGLSSGSALVNLKMVILILAGLVSFAIMLIPRYLQSKISKEPNRIHKVVLGFTKLLVHSLIPVLIFEIFMVMCLSSLSEITAWSLTEHKNSLSLVASSLIYLFVIGTTSTVLIITVATWMEKIKYFTQNYFNAVRSSNFGQFYYFSFLTRRFCLCLLVTIFPRKNVLVFILAFILMNYIQNLYILTNNPFKSKLRNLQELINEIFYLIFGVVILIASQRGKWSTLSEEVLLSLLIGNNLLNFAISIISLATAIMCRFCSIGGQLRVPEISPRIIEQPHFPPVKRHLSIKLEPIQDFEYCSFQHINSKNINTHEKTQNTQEPTSKAPQSPKPMGDNIV
ncbi:unnamed protein product [Moneuplotes crassus]|uniref:TRP C-terminal domain-containing protein n=1 Tax=Euplotes crassus TaxID=5936 RepID=A0AAD1XKZ6_EUPCR|nr:unnamed protein product [Moneuplotes crassus]